MADYGKKHESSWQRGSRAILALGLAMAALGCGDGGSSPTGKNGEAQPAPRAKTGEASRLWERAILALGGRENLSRIQGLRIEARMSEPHQPAHRVTTTIAFPDRLLVEEDALDAQSVMGLNGKESWRALDGVALPSEESDARQHREEILRARLSLYVSLDLEEEVELREAKERDGLQWLEVEFLKEPVGPYRLGFDPKTALLMRAEWPARLRGRGAKDTTISIALADYRSVDGVMVAYKGTCSADDLVLFRNEVTKVTFNPELSAGAFAIPKRETAPIVRREAEPRRVALLTTDDADAEALEDAIKEAGFQRTGPLFHLSEVKTGAQIAVGMAIDRPAAEQPVAAKGESPLTIEDAAGGEVLTLVVAGKVKAPELKLQRQRLLAYAKAHALVAVGPFKDVIWNADVIQLQLPVRAP